MIQYDCTIYDIAEGKLACTVVAASEEDAAEEAEIFAAERGCKDVHEIIVTEKKSSVTIKRESAK